MTWVIHQWDNVQRQATRAQCQRTKHGLYIYKSYSNNQKVQLVFRHALLLHKRAPIIRVLFKSNKPKYYTKISRGHPSHPTRHSSRKCDPSTFITLRAQTYNQRPNESVFAHITTTSRHVILGPVLNASELKHGPT